MKPATWYHLQFTYDGSRSRKGLALYVNGAFVPTYGTGSDNNPLGDPIAAPAKIKLSGAQIAGFKVLGIHADEVEAELLYASDRVVSDDRAALQKIFTYAADPGDSAMVTSGFQKN